MSTNNSTVYELQKGIRAAYPAIDEAFERLTTKLQHELDLIVDLQREGKPVIPDVDFAQIEHTGFTEELSALIRKRGCLIVRNTFERSQAEQWNEDLHEYIKTNQYFEKRDAQLRRSEATSLKHPQILDIYWSKPQVQARQSERLASLRRYLNRLWTFTDGIEQVFNPDKDCCYVDRIRVREPRDQTLGIGMHVDGCSIERWFNQESIEQSYGHLLSGDIENYDPFNALGRVNTQDIPVPCASSVFRTYQGWTALTKQGPFAGTLQLVPTPLGVGWVLMRLLLTDDLDESIYPVPGGSLNLFSELFNPLFAALSSIPEVYPGDTVWWHPDVLHAVEKHNDADEYSNVMYIAAAPECVRNRRYQAMQCTGITTGMSPPDYPQVHAERDFINRASVADLSALGRQQMGLD